MVSRKDYASAKQYIIYLTSKYAAEIVPREVMMRIRIMDVIKSERGRSHPAMAYTTGNKDGTKALLVYDLNLIKTNTYNMKSKFFDALVAHELCHIKHEFEEPGLASRFYHSRPIYTKCVNKYYPDVWAVKPKTHPKRYSFRAYLGSDDQIVPRCINHMMFYVCKDCRKSYLWNSHYIGHYPFHCESCNSSNIAWTKLDPFDVYRVAKINEIDFVEYTAPAIWNEN
jgi:predicted SprT family Zn-dependent metalloprotease